MVTVAILALQGAFIEHEHVLDRLGVDRFEIRQRSDLERPFDALIIPGGESTVIGKLLKDLGILSPLRDRIEKGLPVFGTCAGLIVLSKNVIGGVPSLATMDITVKRNASAAGHPSGFYGNRRSGRLRRAGECHRRRGL